MRTIMKLLIGGSDFLVLDGSILVIIIIVLLEVKVFFYQRFINFINSATLILI